MGLTIERQGQFPVDGILPALATALGESRTAILSAPPGAGKTTRVPPALMKADWLGHGKILMLEPRRLAAVRAAEFMASRLGERPGATVGFRIRGESAVGSGTRIEVVTEGILSRLLHAEPDLPGIGIVVFDEFHERSIHADLGLALTLDVQAHLRTDLRILVMSATLDVGAIARLLGKVPVLETSGILFPVETRYRQSPVEGPLEKAVADTVVQALERSEGDVLVFLPGRREIGRVEQLLLDARLPLVETHVLHSEAAPERQRAALSPSAEGNRKVILSTSIAETSLTIDGVRIVVDGGLARTARFDPRRGMSGLVTGPGSRATADQRRGRAGRQAPGVCYRLWTEGQHAGLPAFPSPEILVTDLAPLALDLALWGSSAGENLRFLDPPPEAHLRQARSLLERLGAIDGGGAPTAHGRQMALLPVHPRLSHMILRGTDLGLGTLACDIAAILEEGDLLRGSGPRDIDIASRLDALWTGSGALPAMRERVLRESRRLRSLVKAEEKSADPRHAGMLVALAFPERIAKSRASGRGRYQMAGGAGAVIPEWSPLAREEFLAIADVDGTGTEVRVFLASAVSREDVLEASAGSVTPDVEIAWSQHDEAVIARRVQRVGALVLSEQQVQAAGDAVRAALFEGIRRLGLGALPWDKGATSFRERSEWLRSAGLVPGDWPDLSDAHLAGMLEQWLGPFVGGITKRTQLENIDLHASLRSLFSASQLREFDRLAPATVTAPSGSALRLDYSSGGQPVLAVRLQEMFGQMETPTVGGGSVPVLLHLLSPAGRPIAVTRDLASFWRKTYREVRGQMQSRYPRHHWPEDPLAAKPTRKAKRRT